MGFLGFLNVFHCFLHCPRVFQDLLSGRNILLVPLFAFYFPKASWERLPQLTILANTFEEGSHH